MHMFVCKNIFSFTLGMYLEVGLLSHMFTLCLPTWEAASLVCKNIFSFTLGMYVEVGLLSHMLTLCLTIWEAASLFHSTAPFYILPAMYEDPNLSKALLKIGILFLIFHHYYSQNVKWYLM